jgi:hypothetical protein
MEPFLTRQCSALLQWGVTSRPVASLAEIGVHVVEVPSDSPLAKAGITTSGSMGNGTLAILLLGRLSAPCCRGGEEVLL